MPIPRPSFPTRLGALAEEDAARAQAHEGDRFRVPSWVPLVGEAPVAPLLGGIAGGLAGGFPGAALGGAGARAAELLLTPARTPLDAASEIGYEAANQAAYGGLDLLGALDQHRALLADAELRRRRGR